MPPLADRINGRWCADGVLDEGTVRGGLSDASVGFKTARYIIGVVIMVGLAITAKPSGVSARKSACNTPRKRASRRAGE